MSVFWRVPLNGGITSNYEVQALINSSWCSRCGLLRTGVCSKNLAAEGYLTASLCQWRMSRTFSRWCPVTELTGRIYQMYYINYCPTLYWQHLVSYWTSSRRRLWDEIIHGKVKLHQNSMLFLHAAFLLTQVSHSNIVSKIIISQPRIRLIKGPYSINMFVGQGLPNPGNRKMDEADQNRHSRDTGAKTNYSPHPQQ